jgi:GT2 family glycosyltransferase
MSISAIVPVWNGRELLARLLDSLEAQTRPAMEILVVDNGSSDGAPELAARRGARVIPMGRNAGFAPAVNRGIAEARGEWIAVLNTDVILAPDYFALLCASETWFATGKLTMESDPGRLDGAFDLICRGGTAWRAGSGMPDSAAFAQPRAIWSAPWTAALFRAALFRKTGLLEESFESYLEDVDFGLRCARLGLAGEYVPAAVARHRGSASLGKWHPEMVRLIARNQVLLLARHYSAAMLFGSALHIGVAHGLWFLLAIRHGTGFAWLRGRFQGWAGWLRTRRAAGPFDPGLLGHFRENERLIAELQSGAGMETYWRWYLLLTGGGEAK